MLALALITPTDEIRADAARLGAERVVELPAGPLEEIVARRARGHDVIVLASPRRRWREVMEALRAAAGVVAGELRLRFYEPAVTISLRQRFATGWRICPLTDEFEHGVGGQASALRRAVRDGMRDLEHEERARLDAEFIARAEKVVTC